MVGGDDRPCRRFLAESLEADEARRRGPLGPWGMRRSDALTTILPSGPTLSVMCPSLIDSIADCSCSRTSERERGVRGSDRLGLMGWSG